ncbi:SusC/RagA family TonB-linked outer membrane protein [Parabacteroides sp.]
MKAKLMLCLCLLLAATTMFAQNLTVTGVVTEKATGFPAIGVSVLVKGTTNGTITSMDGDYTLNDVPKNATLVFSYVGMVTQEVPVNGQTVVNVLLAEDTQNLEEVVVIGYGTSKAKDLTAPITVIKADEITKHATASPMGALQGKVAGVQITNNGQPGSGPSVRIRGIGSMNDNSQPLYVVDGMFFDNIDFLNNSDIQDLSILKDASAASIYGVRAANGVVLVTTKKGALNRPATVTYDGYVGFQKATNVLKMANSEQYATMVNEMGNETLQDVLNQSVKNWGSLPNTNWYDEILRTAMTHNHSVDISGGSEKVSYSVGASYLYQDGILDAENDYSRFNLRTKADYKAFDWLKMGANVVLSNSTQTLPDGQVWMSAFRTPSIIPVYDEKNPLGAYPVNYASPAQVGLSEFYGNPVATANYYDSKNKSLRVMPSFYAQFDFLPENKLFFKTMYSQDINILQNRTYTPEFLVGGTQLNSTSKLKKQNNIYHSWIVDNTLTYTDTFGDHGLTVMLGNSVREENWRNLWGEATGIPGGFEEYFYLNQGNADGRKTGDDGTTYRGVSWFGRVSYDYQGKYLLSATMRADGSSKYQEKWGYFPSIGAAWNISEEDFMKDQNWVDYMKIRASWGKLGNDKIQASDGFASITQDMTTSGIFGGSALPGYTNLVYFSWLGWEVVNETNVGLDFRTLNSRLSVEADWYYRLTQNAVINAPLPMGAGNLLGNQGEILNTGVELSVNWSDKIGKDFSYYIGANLTTLHNEVKDLNGLSYLYGGSAEFRTISRVGGELNAYYGHEVAGVYQNEAEIAADPIAIENGLKPGDFKYVDQNKDGKIDDKDRVTLGSYVPNFSYGINLGFSYKNFDFSMVMQGVTGNQIVNRKRGDRRWHSELNYDADQVENRWTGEGSTNSYPSAAGSVNPWNIAKFNSFYVEDGSYFRIQNVQVAYTFPKKDFGKFKMPSVRLSLTADRPLTIFKANSFSPELSSVKNEDGTMPSSSYGFDERVYPLSSSYTLGLRIIY